MMLSHSIPETNRTTGKVRKSVVSAFVLTHKPLHGVRPSARTDANVTRMASSEDSIKATYYVKRPAMAAVNRLKETQRVQDEPNVMATVPDG